METDPTVAEDENDEENALESDVALDAIVSFNELFVRSKNAPTCSRLCFVFSNPTFALSCARSILRLVSFAIESDVLVAHELTASALEVTAVAVLEVNTAVFSPINLDVDNS
jgi:hypothetical protein